LRIYLKKKRGEVPRKGKGKRTTTRRPLNEGGGWRENGSAGPSSWGGGGVNRAFIRPFHTEGRWEGNHWKKEMPLLKREKKKTPGKV